MKRTCCTMRQVLFLLVTSVSLTLLHACGADQEAEQPLPLAVRVTSPVKINMAERIPYIGTVHAGKEIQVVAQVQGSIRTLPFDEGDEFRKGEVLLVLSVPELEANTERLRAERKYWCARNEADERLLAQQAIPADQVEAGRRACAGATAALKEATSRLEKAVETSTFDGMLLRRFVELGQHVLPGQPIMLVGDNEVQIRVDIVEEDLRRGIAVGSTVMLTIDEAFDVPGRVVERAPQSNMQSRTFTAKIRPTARERFDWRHGASVKVNFIVASVENALAVPTHAIADRDGDAHVFLVRNGRAYKQYVQTGIEEAGLLEVRFSWNGEDMVVISNPGRLSGGEDVFAVESQETRL